MSHLLELGTFLLQAFLLRRCVPFAMRLIRGRNWKVQRSPKLYQRYPRQSL
jgi:hypothetical protein